MRDKLIELIKSGTGINHNGKCDICQTADCIGCLADHLIAHGVTVETGGDLLPRESVINGVLMQMQASSSPVCMEEFLRNLDGVTLAKDNNVLGKTPLTNGDRIRAMSDEELAAWLEELSSRCFACNTEYLGQLPNCHIRPSGDFVCGETDFEKWLKQPAEEDA